MWLTLIMHSTRTCQHTHTYSLLELAYSPKTYLPTMLRSKLLHKEPFRLCEWSCELRGNKRTHNGNKKTRKGKLSRLVVVVFCFVVWKQKGCNTTLMRKVGPLLVGKVWRELGHFSRRMVGTFVKVVGIGRCLHQGLPLTGWFILSLRCLYVCVFVWWTEDRARTGWWFIARR